MQIQLQTDFNAVRSGFVAFGDKYQVVIDIHGQSVDIISLNQLPFNTNQTTIFLCNPVLTL